jgi:hypothetical protein
MKFLISLLILSSVCFGWFPSNNWSGTDTANTVSLYAKYDTIKYSKAFRLSELEDVRVILKANDTSVAGFGGDSIGIRWGYQTLCPCLNASNVLDTCPDQLIVLDSLDVAAMTFGSALGIQGAAGEIARRTHIADTVMCAGYATQSKWMVPEWDVYVRFWVKGIGANKKTVAVPCKIDVQRRQYINVRSK